MSLNKHYRKIPPQLSDDELLSLTTKVLQRSGVENQTQAQFTYEICLEILQRANYNSNFLLRSQITSQNNPKNFYKSTKRNSSNKLNSSNLPNKDMLNPFYSLQPRPKIRKNSIPWNQAYSIAISFLKEFGMHTTLATVEIEFKNSPEKNIVNLKPNKNFNFISSENNDNDSDDEYNRYFPGEEDTLFMENLTASEYISYLQRINDSIHNITGNYSYLTNRGKKYSNKNNSKSNLYSDNSSIISENLIPITFKEKVEDFTRRQNLPPSLKQNGFNNPNSISTSEVILDNGSFIKDGSYRNDNKLRYIDSANRLREMADSYSRKEKLNKNNEIEIDIDIENENGNMNPNLMNFSNNTRAPKNYKNQKASSFSKFKK